MQLKFLPSFVKRRGRITKKQESSLKLLPNYSVSKIDEIYSESKKYKMCNLEIGFGNAENLIYEAINNPSILFIGSEVYLSGIGTLISNIKEKQIQNIRIFPEDIRLLFDQEEKIIFNGIKIICPDPWPKDRHHKRRLIDEFFLNMIHKFMKDKAQLYISTDWENYAHQISCAFNKIDFFNKSNKNLINKIELTKFEKRAINEGRKIFEFTYEKNLNSEELL